MPYTAIRKAIINLDDIMLTVENLRSLRQYIPTKDEAESLQQFDGKYDQLGNAEKYFLEVSYRMNIEWT